MPRIVNLANLQQFTAVNALGTDLGAVPGPVVIPSCAQVVLVWTLPDGKTAHNVLYGRYSGTFAGTATQSNAIHTALSTGASWTALAAFLNTGTAFIGVTLRNVGIADQPIIGSATATALGTGVGAPLPDETAAVITLRTALVGRANRGRLFIPGWNITAAAAGGVMVAGMVTALTNWAATIVGALSGQGYTLVIGQRQRVAYTSPVTGRQFGPRPANSVPVTSLQVRDNHWDSQRRRGLK